MFGFVGRNAVPAARGADVAKGRQAAVSRWFYRGTLAVASLLAAIAVLAPMFPRPRSGTGFATLWLLIATDATLKKALVVGAVGLWLTALAFFRTPAEAEPDFAEPRHDLAH